MIKRGLIGLLIALFAFAIVMPSLYVQADEITKAQFDAEPPVVEEINILTPKIAPGGKAKIHFKVSDDVSGTTDVSFMFYSPSKNATANFRINIKDFTSLVSSFTLETDISKFAEIGHWELALITTQDRAGNSKWYYAHLQENAMMKEVFFEVSNDAPIEEVGIDDGFLALDPKREVPLNKEFTITFNMDIDISTILERNIYVLDSYGSQVPLLFIIDRGQNLTSSQVTVAPASMYGMYRAGSTYTLYIKDVKSTTGQILSQNTKMNFTTQK